MCFISRFLPCLPCFGDYHRESTIPPAEDDDEPIAPFAAMPVSPKARTDSYVSANSRPQTPEQDEPLPSVVGSFTGRGYSPSFHGEEYYREND